MDVRLINPTTKDIAVVKLGFDWPAFCSAFLFGIPHILRGVYTHAAASIALYIVATVEYLTTPTFPPDGRMHVAIILLLVTACLGVYFGLTGSKHFAKHLLARGYVFENPDGELAQAARAKWLIAA